MDINVEKIKIYQRNNGFKTMIQKFIQQIMKENPLLLKDLFQPLKIKFRFI